MVEEDAVHTRPLPTLSDPTNMSPTRSRKRQVAAGALSEITVDLSVGRARQRDRLAALLVGAVLALCFLSAIWNLTDAWLAGRALDWRLCAETLLALTPLVGLAFVLYIVLAHWNWAYVRSLTLRSAALAGYDQVAPMAKRQPARFKPKERKTTPEALDALRRGEASPSRALTAVAGVAVLIVLVTGCWALLRGVTLVGAYAQLAGVLDGIAATNPMQRFSLGALLALDALALLLALGLVVRHLFRPRASRGQSYVADELGLRLATGEQAIAWTAARAFYMAVERRWLGHATRSVYVLDSGALQLSWAIPASANATTGTQHEWLCRTIVTRTRLPLRDLTRETTRLTGWRALWSPPTALAADAIVRSWIHLGVAGTAHARLKRATRPLSAVLALAMLLLALLAGGAALAQRTQAHQQAALLARIYAGKPLYADPLTDPDNDWPTRPAQTPAGMFAFAGGAYRLTGGAASTFLAALAPGSFGDVAVRVTARQIGASPASGVGLILRAQDHPSDRIIFAVDQAGAWFLARYHSSGASASDGAWISLGGDVANRAVHTGSGAANQLTVLMRGTTYTCYVNGAFVGTVRAGASGALTSGGVGLWLGDASTTGAFTDFAVFPAPAA
jgi:hypothetical protein